MPADSYYQFGASSMSATRYQVPGLLPWRGPGTVVFGKARVILLYAAFAALLTSISTRKIVAFLGIAVTCAKGRGFFIQWMRCIIYIQSSAEGLACACLTSKCWQKSEFLLSMEETVQYNCINCIHNLKALRNVLVLPLRVVGIVLYRY